MSWYGLPDVGQAVTQLPHSLQKSESTAIWYGLVDAEGHPSLLDERPILDHERRDIGGERIRAVGHERHVRTDTDTQAADRVAVDAAARLRLRLFGCVREHRLVEVVAHRERCERRRNAVLTSRPPLDQARKVFGRRNRHRGVVDRCPGNCSDDRGGCDLAVCGCLHDR